MRRPLLLALFLFSAQGVSAADIMCGGSTLRYVECRVGSFGKITLVRELSSNICIEGVTWGRSTAGVVWVDRGCHAQFRIEEITGPASLGRIVCESENGGHRVCPANTSQGVKLMRQLSVAACVEEVTWGYEEASRQIWVDDGCRGEFILGRVFEPPGVPKLDGVVKCASSGRRVECKADTSGGVQLARITGNAPCRFNRDWGYNDDGVWVTNGCGAQFAVRTTKAPLQTVVCQSLRGERYHCDAETTLGVALVSEAGDTHCVLDRTWGFDEKGIWVSDGCGGQFAVGGYRLPPSAMPASATKLVCESTAGKRHDCAVEGIRGAGLLRAIGADTCVLNRTWGYHRGGIWVADGCSAEFAVLR